MHCFVDLHKTTLMLTIVCKKFFGLNHIAKLSASACCISWYYQFPMPRNTKIIQNPLLESMSTSSSIQTKFEPHDPQPNDENNISQQNILESAMGSSKNSTAFSYQLLYHHNCTSMGVLYHSYLSTIIFL